MQVRFEARTLYVTGTFTEGEDFSPLLSFFSMFDPKTHPLPLLIDLSSVTRSNSIGLLEWLRIIGSNQFPMVYVRAPIWLAEQFSLLKALLPSHMTVHSFFATFFDTHSEENRHILLEVGKDIPLLESYDTYAFSGPRVEHGRLEADFDCDVFLHFLTRLYERSQNQAS
jgi:hypothetical protein